MGLVVEHFRHRHLSADDLRGPLGVHALNASAPAVEIAHQIACIFDRGLHLDVHHRFEQGGLGRQHAGFEGLARCQLERHFG